MPGSMLIFGGPKEQRENKILEIIKKTATKNIDLKKIWDHPDIRVIEVAEGKKSIGIDLIKSGNRFLQEKPFSLKSKFLVVLDAEKMTTEAQNAFLKTLEEPPSYATIILCAKTQNSLLETVLSRCRKISMEKAKKPTAEVETKSDINLLLKMPLGKRLMWAEETSKEEKETIVQILEDCVEQERAVMKSRDGDLELQRAGENIKKMVEIKENLENTNINTRLALEVLVLGLD